MKNFILSALLAATAATCAFATGEKKISSVILNSFRADFKNAKNVTWSAKTEYPKAEFTLDNHQMEVFYNRAGELVAISKKIGLDELPVNAKRAFAKKYDGYTVTEAIKFDQQAEGAYYLKVENEKESVIIKIDEDDYLSLFQRSKK